MFGGAWLEASKLASFREAAVVAMLLEMRSIEAVGVISGVAYCDVAAAGDAERVDAAGDVFPSRLVGAIAWVESVKCGDVVPGALLARCCMLIIANAEARRM
jgi:hypothetical protein